MASILHDAAAHRAKLEDVLAHIAGTLSSADKIYDTDRSRWEIEWDDLASIGSEVRVINKLDNVRFDTNVFGPQLKQTSKDGQANEIKQVLLAKDKDFTDALINIDRDNFLSNPYDSVIHDVHLLRTVAAGIYAVNRGLFIGMTPDNAMANVHYYRFMIRHLRSQLYLANLITENVDRISERTFNLEVIKEKYEATIFTLRRQLDDYHKAHGAVGKNVDGKVVTNESTGRNVLHSMIAAAASAANTLDAVNNGNGAAAAVLAGYAPADTTATYVVVQIEEVGNLRTRQRALMEKSLEHCKQVMLNTANGYDARRTNYHEENEKRDSHNLPSCYMFKVGETHNAVSFGMELHNELNASEWPKPLIDMKRFGDETLWKGLRVRVGVHFGEASLVESPEGTIVQHYEGVVIDKAMRLASLAGCGECLISKAAWEGYQQVLKEGKVPPSKRYQSLRTMITDKVDSGRKRGFKKDEYYMRIWPQSLVDRKDSKPKESDVDFGLISFFGLEISANVDEEVSDEPTPEELLQAKDTEITLLQQELDGLRLAIIKRDSDIEDIRTKMFSHIGQLGKQMNVKTFYHENLARCLEMQLMKAHDTMSRCSNITAATACGGMRRESESNEGESAQPSIKFDSVSTPIATLLDNDLSLEELDNQRREEFEAWQHEQNGGGGEVAATTGLTRLKSNLSMEQEGQLKKHKNHKLWRELNQLISGATVMSKAPKAKKPAALTQQHGGPASLKDNTVVQKVHSLVRVYGLLLKRYSLAKNDTDVDDKSLSEEQFIQLFLKLTNSDTVGSARDTFHLCMQTAIDSEEIETANANDDSRLMRSVIGHLVKIFLLFRLFRKKAIVDANLLDDEGAAAGGEKTAASSGKKGGKPKRLSMEREKDKAASISTLPSRHSAVTKPSSSTTHSPPLGGSLQRTNTLSASMQSPSTSTSSRPATVNSPSFTPPTANINSKQLDGMEKMNANLTRDLAIKNERIEEAKVKAARDEETIKMLRDELRRVKHEGEGRARAAVAAALDNIKDPLITPNQVSTQPVTSNSASMRGGNATSLAPPSASSSHRPLSKQRSDTSVHTTATVHSRSDVSSAGDPSNSSRRGSLSILSRSGKQSPRSKSPPPPPTISAVKATPIEMEWTTEEPGENEESVVDISNSVEHIEDLQETARPSREGNGVSPSRVLSSSTQVYEPVSSANLPLMDQALQQAGERILLSSASVKSTGRPQAAAMSSVMADDYQPTCHLELLIACLKQFAAPSHPIAILPSKFANAIVSAPTQLGISSNNNATFNPILSLGQSTGAWPSSSQQPNKSSRPSHPTSPVPEGQSTFMNELSLRSKGSLVIGAPSSLENSNRNGHKAPDGSSASEAATKPLPPIRTMSPKSFSQEPLMVVSTQLAATHDDKARTPLSPSNSLVLQPVILRGQTSAMLQQQQQQSIVAPQTEAEDSEGMLIGKGIGYKKSALGGSSRRLVNQVQSLPKEHFDNEAVYGHAIGPDPISPPRAVTSGTTILALDPHTSSPGHRGIHTLGSFHTVKLPVVDLSISPTASSPQHAKHTVTLKRTAPPVETNALVVTPNPNELRFAMTWAENEAVLASAAEERQSFYDKQKRLQDQLLELRTLQKQSQVLMGGKPSGIPHSVHQNDLNWNRKNNEGFGIGLGGESTTGTKKEPALIEITRLVPARKSSTPQTSIIGEFESAKVRHRKSTPSLGSKPISGKSPVSPPLDP